MLVICSRFVRAEAKLVHNMSADQSFFVGKVYTSVDGVKKDIDVNEINFTNFVVSMNNKKSLVFQCTNGRERSSESKGRRQIQHYNYLGCEASINLYKSQKSVFSMKMTKIHLWHNHTVSKDVHDVQHPVLDDEEKELIRTLEEANAKPSQIKRILIERKNKKLTTQQLKNLISKFMKTNNSDDDHNLEQFLQNIGEHGGDIDWIDDSDGSIKVMYISSKYMRNAFLSSEPPVVQMDTTFEVEKGRYELGAFCYLNPTINITEIAALSMMSDETRENYYFVLSKFKNLCRREDIFVPRRQRFHEHREHQEGFQRSDYTPLRFSRPQIHACAHLYGDDKS